MTGNADYVRLIRNQIQSLDKITAWNKEAIESQVRIIALLDRRDLKKQAIDHLDLMKTSQVGFLKQRSRFAAKLVRAVGGQ